MLPDRIVDVKQPGCAAEQRNGLSRSDGGRVQARLSCRSGTAGLARRDEVDELFGQTVRGGAASPDGHDDRLVAHGYEPDPADVARLSPLGHPTINLNGRYRTTSRAPSGELRPLRTTG